jgi:hypothetical protein
MCACAKLKSSSASAAPARWRARIPISKKYRCASRAASGRGFVLALIVSIILDSIKT